MMDRFFYYVLIALSIIGLLAMVFFILAAMFGKGGDPNPSVCVPAAIGCLFEAALCWVLAKLLRYIGLRIENMEE